MKIKGEDYLVAYIPEESKVRFEGTLRLRGAEGYSEIVALLEKVADKSQGKLSICFKKLRFLNSSGINAISRFVIKIRNNKEPGLTIIGANDIPWQGKTLKNLQRLMPNLNLELD